ncbi:hypothetical protein FNV61_00090 (plasmid) [Streptomyces sp. RLB3-6]|nr:hypothetical protein FNV61_00090 [Streptomyces sp. RLB3-6]
MATRTAHGSGVQVFTYHQADLQFSDVKERALADAMAPDAIRHRGGADIDPATLKIRTRTLDICTA